jgi:hypothetical protein
LRDNRFTLATAATALCFVLDDETGQSVLDDLRHRAAIEGYDGCTAGHGLDRHEAERLGPIDRREQSDGAAEKFRFFAVADLADIIDIR